jgi:threonine dehydrogenase-like Zn-dependent dehydrogenase
MLAARLHAGARHFEVEEIAVPAIGRDECLVAVRACGICASDLHIMEGVTPTPYRPITLGHESAGVVAEVGEGVEGFAQGDHVFVNPIVTCGVCDPCRRGRQQMCASRALIGIHREGAFAQYVAVPATNLFRLPEGLSFEEAAIIESASTPFHALTARAPVGVGDTVAVIGVGGLGVHGVQIARLCGAVVVIAVDVFDEPLDRARRLGATAAINARHQDPVAEIKRITGGGVDVALECVGRSDTISWAVECLRPGGVAAIAGIGPDPIVAPPSTVFARQELDVRGVYAYTPAEITRVTELIASGALDARVAISQTVTLSDINVGLQNFREKTTFPVRVVVTIPAAGG